MSYKLFITDLLAVYFGFLSGYFLRIQSGLFSTSDIPFSLYYHLILLSLILALFVFLNSDIYRERRGYFKPEEFFSVTKSYVLVFTILMALTYLTKGFIFSRLIILFAFAFSIFYSSLFRYSYRRIFKLRKKRVMIFGKDIMGERILKKIQQNPELNYTFVGFLHTLKELDKHKNSIDILFITKKIHADLQSLLEHYEHIEFKFVSDFMNILMEPVNFDDFSDIPLIEIKRRQAHSLYYGVFKRAFDFLMALFLLIVLSPIFVLIILLIRVTSKGPAIIRQQRLGYKEHSFIFYKFRTMYLDCVSNGVLENDVDYLFKRKHDPRVTIIGRCLRRFCLDELPQLYNVLKGDMGLVGPRPHFAEEMRNLQGFQRKRFEVRPGMTGLWQISGRHDLSFERTMLLDIYYVKHISFLLDLNILLRTVPSILFSRGYW